MGDCNIQSTVSLLHFNLLQNIKTFSKHQGKIFYSSCREMKTEMKTLWVLKALGHCHTLGKHLKAKGSQEFSPLLL